MSYSNIVVEHNLTFLPVEQPPMPLYISTVTVSFVLFQLEPGLLPEPNHVMLNHLYALSIKVITHHASWVSGMLRVLDF